MFRNINLLIMLIFGVVVDLTEEAKDVEESATAAFCLCLPGKKLYLTHLLALKKFRKRGNKDEHFTLWLMKDWERCWNLLMPEAHMV